MFLTVFYINKTNCLNFVNNKCEFSKVKIKTVYFKTRRKIM